MRLVWICAFACLFVLLGLWRGDHDRSGFPGTAVRTIHRGDEAGIRRHHERYRAALRFPLRAARRRRKRSSDLVLVRFTGKCVLEPVGYLYDERGPMAFTYSTDGVVQPFSEVACDKVTSVVRSAMSGGDFANADVLLGRALGRVLAHEVVHILSKSACARAHRGGQDGALGQPVDRAGTAARGGRPGTDPQPLAPADNLSNKII